MGQNSGASCHIHYTCDRVETILSGGILLGTEEHTDVLGRGVLPWFQSDMVQG